MPKIKISPINLISLQDQKMSAVQSNVLSLNNFADPL